MLKEHPDNTLQRVPISEKDRDSIRQDVMTSEHQHFILQAVATKHRESISQKCTKLVRNVAA
jgi:hypothetical protein